MGVDVRDSSLSQDGGNEDLEVGKTPQPQRDAMVLGPTHRPNDDGETPPKYRTQSGTDILTTRPFFRRPTSASASDDNTETDLDDFAPTPLEITKRHSANSANSAAFSRSSFQMRSSFQTSRMAASHASDAWFNVDEDYWLPPPGPPGSPLQVDFRCACFKLTDVSTVSFTAMIKFVVIFEWDDPRIRGMPVTTNDLPGDLWGPDIILENAQDDISVIYDSFSLLSQETGRLKRTVTFHGRIFNPMSLKDFPFDNDDLELKFISICNWRTLDLSRHGNDPVKQVYILKPILDRSDVPFFLLGWGGKVNEFKMLGWKEVVINPKTAGPPIIFKFDLQLARKWNYYLWKVCVPLWIIVLTSIAPYGIDPSEFQGRLEVIFTLLLSSVALLYVVQESIPKISFLTVIDKVVIASLLSLAISVLFAYLIKVWNQLNFVLAVVDQILYWVANIFILVPPYLRYQRYVASVADPGAETKQELMNIGRMESSINIKKRTYSFKNRTYSFSVPSGNKRQLTSRLSVERSQNNILERKSSTQSFGKAKRTYSLTPSKTLCTQEVESILNQLDDSGSMCDSGE
ncbi:hypothetical protein THAOC_16664 [Thalassiosira oceanica]|uniref:Neurotransmitter-gated ion-channel ligand-binding domain-containing protein n=1 Tax=Thalassiosira oceanica TaxID=159749 RepID=K0SBQ1_THAOC|nr:hypothetical protein THAOC_16664 [Thalassiosira oceanica]|eukprot:EJK62710.1 hypothetical protein THAOC_16664 [Thalassiosira oceanica]